MKLMINTYNNNYFYRTSEYILYINIKNKIIINSNKKLVKMIKTLKYA